MMASLCAECRDENIAKLRATNDPSECFRLSNKTKANFKSTFLFSEVLWKY